MGVSDRRTVFHQAKGCYLCELLNLLAREPLECLEIHAYGFLAGAQLRAVFEERKKEIEIVGRKDIKK
jgi:hypothetical protein